jgi:protein-S-isoprenylcysteine O-methyltransferase Ste14
MDSDERPNSIPWPPILFLSALLAANLLTWLIPSAMLRPPQLLVVVGTTIVVASLGLMLWAFLAFKAHKTSVLPHRRSDTLITSGPFGWTRNPIYLAECVLLTGLALTNGSLWYAAVIPPFLWAVTRLAILREEAHLAARFGDAWTTYAARVRRWV